MIAIIGNKGSGKSALADVIALLGNSRQTAHFSFLNKDRFRGRSGEPAKHFVGVLTWRDGSTEKRNLNDDPGPDKVELVRYIPQGHFEELCNEHVSGRSNAFEKELRSVIFSHADESIRLGALDFDQLIDQQEVGFRDRLGELRRQLKKLNEEVVAIEAQLQPDVRRSLEELLVLKNRQIEELNKIRPQEEPAPTDQLSTEQQAGAEALEKIAVALKEVEQRAAVRSASVSLLARKQRAVNNIRERVRQVEKAHGQFEDDTASDLDLLNLKVADITAFTVSTQPLDQIASTIPAEQDALNASVARDAEDKAGLQSEQIALRAKLNAPQLVYQQSLKAIEEWSGKLADLIGAENLPETQKGLEMRITQINALPEKLTERRGARLHMAAEIFDVLDEQRQARARLFEPVQDLIRRNSLIRDEYKLQFQATLNISPDVIADSLFSLIKQQSGEFRGGDESFTAVRKVADRFEMGARAGILGFIAELNAKVERAAAGADATSIGIGDALRKGKSANEVYDLLFGLSFLEPRYSLLFQDARIEQLSPGQRGALLLIFYLLVDKGRNPIILDQPEENLDNQTVVSLLVPVLTEAKKRRQIIMVTHNPNLAVVCDAEQVVYSSFDRKGLSTIAYTAGAIENAEINIHVVDVLEGTKPAFDNRGNKYH